MWLLNFLLQQSIENLNPIITHCLFMSKLTLLGPLGVSNLFSIFGEKRLPSSMGRRARSRPCWTRGPTPGPSSPVIQVPQLQSLALGHLSETEASQWASGPKVPYYQLLRGVRWWLVSWEPLLMWRPVAVSRVSMQPGKASPDPLRP